MKKKLLLLFASAFTFWQGFAQSGGNTITTNPSNAEEIYTLPVVFHVIHSGDKAFSMPNAQEFIDAINNSFSMQEYTYIKAKEAGKLPDYFLKDVPEDTKIRFCLAHTDTAGNATSGITFKYVGPGPVHFTQTKYIFDPNKGGVKPWDINKYINIYMLDDIPEKDAAGFAVKKSGIVMDRYNHIISNYAHEIGHYLGLPHTWGGINKTNKGCNIDDGFTDTPPQEGPSLYHSDISKVYNGNFFTQLISCDNEALGGNQYINIMDYGYGMVFTNQQKAAMRKYVEDNHPGMIGSNKCNVGTCKNDKYDAEAPNNDFDAATLINPEEYEKEGLASSRGIYYGLLCKGDVDVYKFKGKKGNKIAVNANLQYGYSGEGFTINVELYKKQDGEYKKITPYKLYKGDYIEYFIDEVQTGDEEYFVKVTGLTAEDYHSFYEYLLNIKNFIAASTPPETNSKHCYKYDGNGTLGGAEPIIEPTEINSMICSDKDVDYYKVNLEGISNLENMSNELNITLDMINNDLDVKVYDSEGKIVSPPVKKGTVTEGFTLFLPEGLYYIEVKTKDKNLGDGALYTLTVNFDWSFEQGVDAGLYCIDSKYEPNETLTGATPIDYYQHIDEKTSLYIAKDYICPANDNDMYSLVLTKTSDVTIFLSGEEYGNTLPANYNVFLSDEINLLYDAQNEGTDKEMLVAKNLKPGKYIIQVMGQDIWVHNRTKPYYVKAYVTEVNNKNIQPNDNPITNISSNPRATDKSIATIFPNPAKENISITLSNNITARQAELNISNIYGNIVTQKKVDFINGKLTTTVNVANFPKGIYTVTIKSNREVYTTRLIIEK